MAVNSNEYTKQDNELTPKQKEFVDFLQQASNQSKDYKQPKLNTIRNLIIYAGFVAIGIFLVYLYSSYIFINK